MVIFNKTVRVSKHLISLSDQLQQRYEKVYVFYIEIVLNGRIGYKRYNYRSNLYILGGDNPRISCNFASMKQILSFLMTALAPITGMAQDFNGGWTFRSNTQSEAVAVTLPHDAQYAETRTSDGDGGEAYFPGGTYIYEKIFNVPAEWVDKHVTLHFDGVYRNAVVSINGKEAGRQYYGYMPFDVCLDGLLREGANSIRVDVDNSAQPNSRWYSGAGIYRPVTLKVQESKYIESVKVTTLGINPAVIRVETAHRGEKVHVAIWDGDKKVAETDGADVQMEIPGAKLWDAEHPNLYRAEVTLDSGDRVCEEFGIRTLSWNAEEGFLVNGKSVLLKGGCLHHDNGVLAAREYEDAALRKIAILKSFGFNAVRISHNPASDEMLRACDRLGMYVMDELWDMWFFSKTAGDYSLWWKDLYMEDIAAFVTRDYNHPSVVMYSVGNELSEPALEGGIDYLEKIVSEMHRLDVSRPLTAGANLMILTMTAMGQNIFAGDGGGMLGGGGEGMTSTQYNEMMATTGDRMNGEFLTREETEAIFNPFLNKLDIAGYNYASVRYPVEGDRNPERVVVGSETFMQDLPKNWNMVKQYPFLIGDFMWTAWDYLGEVGIGAWSYEADAMNFRKPFPWLLADTGAFDITGYPSGEAFRARATWEEGKHAPYICVRPIEDNELIKAIWRGTNTRPSWSWRGCEGRPTQVEVFTNAKKVKLYVNGKKVGTQAVEDQLASFDVPYAEGEIKAVAIYGWFSRRKAVLKSATGDLRVRIQAEKESYSPGDLIYVDVDIVGANGVVESKADAPLHLQVEGADLLGFGSARPRSSENFLSGTYTPYYGHAQAVLRASKAGPVTLRVSSDKYPEAVCQIDIR